MLSNEVVKTTTQRPSSSAILAIDSEDRFKNYTEQRDVLMTTGYNASAYDFQINKNESLMNGFFTRLGVTEVVFPWAIPNINNKTQDIYVTYKIGAAAPVTTIVSLLQGFYKPSEIATALQTDIRALNAALVPFTMTYGQATLEVPQFFYETNDANVLISFAPLPYNSVSAPAYPYPNTTKQLFDLLGFSTGGANANTDLEDVGFGTYTLCQAIRYVDIVCSQLTYNQGLKDTMSQTTARDTLCRVYLADANNSGNNTLSPTDANFCPAGCAPAILYRNFAIPKYIQWRPDQPVIGGLRFQVYDDAGAILSESAIGNTLEENTLDWSMTLLVSEN